MSPSDALYRAVCAAPHDDLPRLVYADWLEENGRGERAEFIRVQCRLANASPADADYVDLLEREAELKAVLWRELDGDRPALPPGIGWEPEHRGFAERLRLGHASVWRNTAELLGTISAGVPISGLRFDYFGTERSAPLASGDFHRTVTSLDVPYTTFAGDEDLAGPFRDGRFPHLRRLVTGGGENLLLSGALSDGAERELWELHLPGLLISDRLPAFPSAGTLRSLSLHAGIGRVPTPFPELHTFRGDRLIPADADALFGLPKLASLTLTQAHSTTILRLAEGGRPLVELNVTFQPFALNVDRHFEADWVRRLRRVSVSGAGVHAPGLILSPVLTGVRGVSVGAIEGGRFSFANLAVAAWWPSVTTLEIPFTGWGVEAGELLASVEAPNLKHLNLKGVPLGDAGAVTLAENGSLANLTRLNLSACRIGPRGVEALLNSPHLQRLIELNLYANNGGEALRPLADAGVLPNLGLADVAANGVSDELRARLEQRPAIRAR